jgi:hypothetical protein
MSFGSYMNGYVGSSNLQTSVANQEIISLPPVTWYYKTYLFYKFEFFNDQDCHIIINNTTPIFVRALQGFSSCTPDNGISSFKIVEDGITFNWVGEY